MICYPHPSPDPGAAKVVTVTGHEIPAEDVEWLTQRTHYTSEEIQILYNGSQGPQRIFGSHRDI